MTAYTIPKLGHPAEIRIDRSGIPHIRAGSRLDAFVAQGFNAARDRLWQIDLWRKRGLGLLAADFGPGFLAQDRAARLFLYRGAMEAEWAAYGVADAREVTEAFVAGINAYVALTRQDPALLPPEFTVMGTTPALWQAEDVVRIRSNALVRNVLSEAARAQVIARAGMDADLARKAIEPPWTVHIPEGLDPAEIPEAVLDVFRLATVPVDFSAERMQAGLAEAWRWTRVTELGEVFADPENEGSNNWAVAGSRTATGRPILASDPHRAHSLPSLRYIVHLTAPGMDVIGAGEPALPGLSNGHNGHAAFGLTIFPMDQEDLYVYQADGPRIRYGDGWEDMQIVRERIDVRGAEAQEVELRFTRHGPVVHETADRAFAIRSVWFEPGSSAYFAALGYLGATSAEAFGAALRHWSVPTVNQVYADAAGDIAWFTAGRVPRRPNWDGMLPVPGDGRYEWDGFTSPDLLPRAVNPPRGFVATANEMNLPADFDNTTHKIGFEWSERSRSERIHAVLDGQPRHTLDDSMRLQNDDTSLPAQRILALLRDLPADAVPAEARQMLLGWNGVLSRDSAAAALMEIWWSKHLKPALLDRVTADRVARRLLVPGDVATLIPMLEALPDRATLLPETLARAWTTTGTLLGEDPSTWQWGRLHHGFFEHPLARLSPIRSVGPLPKGGSGSTPDAAGYRLTDFRVTHGASFRMVVDVGDWDRSVAINAPGQSGAPDSAHYDDLAPLWAAGEYVPLPYSEAAVDAATETVIRLLPGVPA
jgi:penicillin amidase